MNLLQNEGIISDLCIYPSEVHASNCEKACAYLTRRIEEAKRLSQLRQP